MRKVVLSQYCTVTELGKVFCFSVLHEDGVW